MTIDTMKDDSIVAETTHDHGDGYLEQYDDKDDNVDPSVPVRYRGTAVDKKDMKVLGKTQVLRVRLFEEDLYHHN